MGERKEPDIFSQNIRRFIRLGNEHGVNNYRIVGTPGRHAMLEVLFGHFPGVCGTTGMVLATGEPGVDPDEYIKKVLELKVPEDMINLGVPDNKTLRDGVERIMLRGAFPSQVLAIGRSGEQEIIILYSIVGISPETALKEIQSGMLKGITRGETFREEG